MYKSATVLGLVAIAAAQAPGSYGDSSSAAPAYGSSAAPVSSSSYDPVPSTSSAWGSAPAYPSASGSYSSAAVSSSAVPSYPASYSASYSVSAVASSSSYYYASASSSAVIPSSSPYPVCWTECFEEAGITSESALCGNVEVDQCITSSCCVEESWAYWQWYDSFCPAPSSSSSYVVVSSTVYSSSPASATPTDDCWTDCFAENGVTSEADLCGNTAVDACIHDTCSPALDKAYWDWYTGYCVAESSSVVTVTTVYTPTATPDGGYTTTYEYTSQYGYTWTSSATTLPVAPASPVAPYGGYSTATWGTSVATAATTYASPTASEWAPVPATGAGAMTKPGAFFAAAMALAAFF